MCKYFLQDPFKVLDRAMGTQSAGDAANKAAGAQAEQSQAATVQAAAAKPVMSVTPATSPAQAAQSVNAGALASFLKKSTSGARSFGSTIASGVNGDLSSSSRATKTLLGS